MGNGIYRGVVREEPPSDPPKGVQVTHGKLRIIVPYAVMALAFGAFGSWLAAERLRPQDTATQSAAYAELAHKLDAAEAKAEAREQARSVEMAAVLNRLSGLETTAGELRATNIALLAAIRSR